jgi:hypothetical protein
MSEMHEFNPSEPSRNPALCPVSTAILEGYQIRLTGMLLLELLQHLGLLLLITVRQALLFLALVIHHLLNHSSGLAIKISQLRTLRRDLAGIDLRGVGNHMLPPFHLVDLVEMNRELFLPARNGLKCPG